MQWGLSRAEDSNLNSEVKDRQCASRVCGGSEAIE